MVYFDFLMPQYLFNYHYFQNSMNQVLLKIMTKKNKTAKKLVTPFILRRNKKKY